MTKEDFLSLLETTQRAAGKLISLVPPDKVEWRPARQLPSFGEMIAAMVQDMEVIKALFVNTLTEWDFDAEELENPVVKSMTSQEALREWETDGAAVRQQLRSLERKEFRDKMLQAPWGLTASAEVLLTVMLLQRKAAANMALYQYLKMIGVPVDTGTLYFGEAPEPDGA